MKYQLSDEELKKLSEAYLELNDTERKYPTFADYMNEYLEKRKLEVKEIYDKHMKGE